MPTSTATHHRRKIRQQARRANGWSLGMTNTHVDRTMVRIAEGFPYSYVSQFQQMTQLPLERVLEWIRLPLRTLTRRKVEGRLAPDESERLFRSAYVFEQAVNLFEDDRSAAIHWLQTPQPALGGSEPLEFSRTDLGAREVEDLIGRLQHGVFV